MSTTPPLPTSVPETLDSTAASPPLPPPEAPDSNQLDPSAAAEEAAETPPDAVEISGDGEGDEGEEDGEQAECGFCLFMKGGGCKDAFIAWEECVEGTHETGEDVVVKCFEVTSQLKKCMDAHSDYYEPILRAEQAMSDAVEAEAAESSAEVVTEAAGSKG